MADGEYRFQFILARDLHMTVADLRRRMSAFEFSEWAALYIIEGQERERAQQQARAPRIRGHR